MRDEQIIGLFFERSESALAAVDENYGRYCRSIAGRILNNAEDTEECVNDAYLRAWGSIPPKRPSSLKLFLGRITRNIAINRLEKATSLKRGGGELVFALEELGECVPADDLNAHIADDLTIKTVLDRFLDDLSPEARRVFVRRYWHLEPIKQIAASFGMSESKVAVSLYRARKALKAELEKEGVSL